MSNFCMNCGAHLQAHLDQLDYSGADQECCSAECRDALVWTRDHKACRIELATEVFPCLCCGLERSVKSVAHRMATGWGHNSMIHLCAEHSAELAAELLRSDS